jgi:hypothetical protein
MIKWTLEHQQQLREMWERGDKTGDIAKALGIKASAVSAARAKFKLTPRGKVTGRPKIIDEEPAHKIERVAIVTSRLMEFASEKELVAQCGHESYEWAEVAFKELVDNAIDASEEAGIAPIVKITLTSGTKQQPTARIVFEDNGRGIPGETISNVINYNVRVSSREAYISPTRGRQGNALKTILAMAYVLTQNVGETRIEARGIKHDIRFSVDQIKQEPIVKNTQSRSRITTGSKVTICWPKQLDVDNILVLMNCYVWVNPHLSLVFRRDGETLIDHKATTADWTKYRACDATSAHWYSPQQFERYAAALIDRDQTRPRKRNDCSKYTVRDFISQFRGMSSTRRQRQILEEIKAQHVSLHRLFGTSTRVNHDKMQQLLKLLKQHTRPVRPELLGVIGKEHMQRMILEADAQPETFWYGVFPGVNANGAPYITEIATGIHKLGLIAGQRAPTRRLITGVNYSATLDNPFDTLRGMEGMSAMLMELRAGEYKPVIVCVHYACPHIEYLDRGKSRIGLD